MGEDRWSIREVCWGTLQSSGEQGMHDAPGRRESLPDSSAKRA
jgi:hypothetical protein